MSIAAIFSPEVAPYHPEDVDFEASPALGGGQPSWDHLLGADAFGRDILSRLIYSKFISLPNILSEKKIVKELLQSQVNFNNLVYELDILMNEDNREMKLNFENLHRSLINDNQSKFFSVIESI